MPSAPSQALSCVLAGSESLLIQCGELLREKGWKITRVVSRDEEILDWAGKAGLEVCPPGRELASRLGGVEFDYFFSITNLSIIPGDVIAMARRGAVNFHDGPLPRYAGMYTPAWAILNGESEYGITFHEMTEGLDEGRILVQQHFPISQDETSLSLNTKCYVAAIEAFGELTNRIMSDSLEPTDQDLAERSYFGRHERPEAAGLIDWTAPAEEISCWVRAMDFGARYANPFSVAKLIHGGSLATVRSALPADHPSDAVAGTLLEISEAGWVVRCGDGAVSLSGLGCPRGLEWSGTQAAEHLGVAVGDVLGAGDAIDRAALSALNAELVPAEAFWVRRLSQLEPIEAPYRTGESAGAQADARRIESLPLDAASLLAPIESDLRAESMVAGFALYLARIQGLDAFDLTWSEDALAMRVAAAGPLYSRHVPLRLGIDRESSTRGALAAVREAITKVRDKGSFLVDAISRNPQLAAHPLLGAGRFTSVAAGLHGAPEQCALPNGTDLALFVSPDASASRLVFDRDVIAPAAANKLRAELEVLLAALAADSDRPVAKLPLIDDDARRQILHGWNQTAVEFDRSATIRSLFEARVETSPDATALVFEGESLSYRELDERAGRLANHLGALGIGPDRLVGIHLRPIDRHGGRRARRAEGRRRLRAARSGLSRGPHRLHDRGLGRLGGAHACGRGASAGL